MFYCDPGFELIGDKERVCRNDSTWSGSQPRCKSNKICILSLHVFT